MGPAKDVPVAIHTSRLFFQDMSPAMANSMSAVADRRSCWYPSTQMAFRPVLQRIFERHIIVFAHG